MSAAPELLAELAARRRLVDRQGDRVVELAVAELLEDGLLGRHIRKTRRVYARRREALLDGIASDLVITGADRNDIGVLIVPNLAALAKHGFVTEQSDGALVGDTLSNEVERRLAERARQFSGSAMRVTRALIMSEPPSVGDGEITAKGNLNFRKLLDRRATLLERLYEDNDPATVTV